MSEDTNTIKEIKNTHEKNHEEPSNHSSEDSTSKIQEEKTQVVKIEENTTSSNTNNNTSKTSDQKREETSHSEVTRAPLDSIISTVKNFFQSAFTPSSKNKDDLKDQDNHDLTPEQRQRENLIKKGITFLPYLLLAIIIYITSNIRIQTLSNLKDAITGKYIPLALDPYLFYRYAHYIQENGSLFAVDTGRFVPEGISTLEHLFKTNFMVYLHKVVNIFAPNQGLDFTVVIYPVICFAIALVFFYLLNKELFDKKTALLATLFLGIVPAFIQRTMAGFSDHEALGIMFFFIAMWLFIKTVKSSTTKQKLLYSLGTGIATGLMGQSWGGWKFLILIISGYTLIQFILGKLSKDDIYGYFIWMASVMLIVSLWIPIYPISRLINSFTTAIAFLTLGVLLLELLSQTKAIKKLIAPLEEKIPHSLIILVAAISLGTIVLIISGNFTEVLSQGSEIWDGLIRPLGKNRWELTVAEQHQPYFTQWMSQFGPSIFGVRNLPAYLILFMLGSVFVFSDMVKKLKNPKSLTAVYIAFILGFTLSRYSQGSTLNGTNTISIALYIGSLLAFAAILAGYYLHSFYKDKHNFNLIQKISKEHIILMIWFVLMVVGARGAIRLFFMFAPITAVLAAHATFKLYNKALTIKQKYYKAIAIALLLFVLFSPFASPMNGIVPTFYKNSASQAEYNGPGYSYQWQLAGEWVRENIPEDAVFAHWWDYGYWVQTGWERNTVLDGTNKITYWNFLMGRYVMTGQNQEEALEWLDVHEATHFLIVPEEIGKYTAYSSIGSDANYDRYSYITTFLFDETLMQETRDGTMIVYNGGYSLDKDFIYEDKLFPSGSAGIGRFFVPVQTVTTTSESGEELTGVRISQPSAIVVYNGVQTEIPVECVFINGEATWFDQEGLKGCLTIIPTIDGNGQIDNEMGAALYVSEKGVNALWTNLYIFEGGNARYDTSAFTKVFDQSSTWAPLSFLKAQNRIIGPIKIWEINYPEGFEVSEELRELYLGGNENLPDYFFEVS